MQSLASMACSENLSWAWIVLSRGGPGQPGTMSSRSVAASELRGNWASLQKFGVATVRRYPGTVLVRQLAVEHARQALASTKLYSWPGLPTSLAAITNIQLLIAKQTSTFPGDVHCGTHSSLFWPQ